jgi:hypothetical protein
MAGARWVNAATFPPCDFITTAVDLAMMAAAQRQADGKADAYPVLDGALKDAPRLVEVVAGVEHLLDRRAVLDALIDLVEAILVREDRVVRFPCLTKGRLLH